MHTYVLQGYTKGGPLHFDARLLNRAPSTPTVAACSRVHGTSPEPSAVQWSAHMPCTLLAGPHPKSQRTGPASQVSLHGIRTGLPLLRPQTQGWARVEHPSANIVPSKRSRAMHPSGNSPSHGRRMLSHPSPIPTHSIRDGAHAQADKHQRGTHRAASPMRATKPPVHSHPTKSSAAMKA